MLVVVRLEHLSGSAFNFVLSHSLKHSDTKLAAAGHKKNLSTGNWTLAEPPMP